MYVFYCQHLLSRWKQLSKGLHLNPLQNCPVQTFFPCLDSPILSYHYTTSSSISVCPVLCLAAQSCPTLCNPMDCSPQASLSLGILQGRIQECWSGSPSPPPRDLPNLGIKPGSPTLPANSLLTEPPGKPEADLTWCPCWQNLSFALSSVWATYFCGHVSLCILYVISRPQCKFILATESCLWWLADLKKLISRQSGWT